MPRLPGGCKHHQHRRHVVACDHHETRSRRKTSAAGSEGETLQAAKGSNAFFLKKKKPVPVQLRTGKAGYRASQPHGLGQVRRKAGVQHLLGGIPPGFRFSSLSRFGVVSNFFTLVLSWVREPKPIQTRPDFWRTKNLGFGLSGRLRRSEGNGPATRLDDG